MSIKACLIAFRSTNTMQINELLKGNVGDRAKKKIYRR
jgi:hypothetical protein